jgi:hypothetical protein
MHIEITSIDIKNGQKGSSQYCPTALAIKAHFNDGRKVSVGLSTVNIHNGNGYDCYRLGKEGVEFERDFDVGNPVYPILLEMEFHHSKKG